MTPQAIQQLQTSLGVPATGVWDSQTNAAFSEAVGRSAAANPDVQAYAGANATDAIVNAFMTGDWSGVTDLTGKPFSDQQQQAAVAKATEALAPAYQAQEAKDRADVTDTLRKNQEDLGTFERDQATSFGKDKTTLDQNAADSGVLFSGSRLQKQNDLRTSYQNAEADRRRQAAESAASTARGYQYSYGNDAAKSLSGYYTMPGAPTYNAGVAGGKVTPARTLASAYDPNAYDFQGTAPVAQKAAIQTRAAGLLANRANKLTLSGVGAKF